MRTRKKRGIESVKSRYGLMFVSPWIVGFVLFFAVPLFESVRYSFSSVVLTAQGMNASFAGVSNYTNLLFADANYTKDLGQAVFSFMYSLPLILVVSMILALLLNQKFRGRIFFRALYFLPVIIASGVVLDLLFQTTSSNITSTSVSETLTGNMFTVSDVMAQLDLPSAVASYVQSAITSIFDLIWNSGIQIVLFIAGMQSIPSSLYEASKVEGATKWEEYWFITFPMLARVTLLVAIFTMIESFTNNRNPLIRLAYTQMKAGVYDSTSAMLWLYFLIIGAVMGVLVALYSRFVMKRYE